MAKEEWVKATEEDAVAAGSVGLQANLNEHRTKSTQGPIEMLAKHRARHGSSVPLRW